jgi:hypothetical protein
VLQLQHWKIVPDLEAPRGSVATEWSERSMLVLVKLLPVLFSQTYCSVGQDGSPVRDCHTSYGMLIIGATTHVNCKLNRILKWLFILARTVKLKPIDQRRDLCFSAKGMIASYPLQCCVLLPSREAYLAMSLRWWGRLHDGGKLPVVENFPEPPPSKSRDIAAKRATACPAWNITQAQTWENGRV